MIHFKENSHNCRGLVSLFAGILTFIIAAFFSSEIASAQTRIISLSGDLDFGRIPLRSSAQRSLTISNSGDSVLTVSRVDFPAIPAIEVVDLEGRWSGQIAPGESQEVVITFMPVALAAMGTNDFDFEGLLSVESDATDGTNYILMSGVGAWPPASRILSPIRNLNFGNVAIGGTGEFDLNITNLGNAPLTITNITLPEGFAFSLGFSAFDSVTIDAGAVTNIFFLFNPTTVGAYGGSVTIYSDSTEGNGTNSPGTEPFAVSGTGVYPSGKFIGLFAPTNDATFENSGYVTGTCDAKGKFRGTLTLAGKRYPFSSKVSPSGAASATIVRKKLGNLNVSLQYNIFDFRRNWSGSVDGGAWTSDLRIAPAVLLKKNSLRVVGSGKYAIAIAGSTNASIGPTEPGAGSIAVKTTAATQVTGTLGDGTRFSQKTILFGTDLPFYAPLYHNRGAILGWITIERVITTDPPIVVILPPRTNPPVVIPPFPPVIIPPIILGPWTNPPIVISPITNPPIHIGPVSTNPPVIIFAPLSNNPPIFIQREAERSTITASASVQASSNAPRYQITGALNWFKPAGIDRDYPDGFSFQTTVSGSVP